MISVGPYPEWHKNARCRATLTPPTRKLCSSCPVADDCLRTALENDEPSYLLWGGMDWFERRAVLKASGWDVERAMVLARGTVDVRKTRRTAKAGL